MKQRSTAERGSSYPGTRAVSRAIAILKAFGGARSEWGVTELATEVGLHKTTTFRLLAALEADGLVARNAVSGSFRIGPELIALGVHALRSTDLYDAARGELMALAADTGETTTLEILVGHESLILDEVQGRHILGGSSEIGRRWPAYATSTGKVLLAAARHEEDRRGGTAMRLRLEKLTPRTISSLVQLDRELSKVWRQGYATAVGELELGFVAVGAPVRDHQNRVVAAVSIGGPRDRMTGKRIAQLVPRVQRAANAISRRLGAMPTVRHAQAEYATANP